MEIGKNPTTFDRLPEEIVANIVDKLGLKDATKTSVLSRRFLHVLKTCAALKKNLDFESFVGAESRFEFAESVNHSLDHIHQGSKVDSLRISFDVMLGWNARDSVQTFDKFKDEYYDNWVRFARAKCVQRLEIDLCRSARLDPEFCTLATTDRAPFRPQFPILQGWDNLTSLTLNLVQLTDADLEHALRSQLLNLESLFIQNALPLTRVVVESPKLKRLEIISCSNVSSIDINFAPNLSYFRYGAGSYQRWYHKILQLKDVPKLSHVSLIGWALSQDSVSKLHKVETLEKLELLDASNLLPKGVFRPTFAKTFDNLTELTLRSIHFEDEDLGQNLRSHLVNLESLIIQNSSHLEKVVFNNSFPKLKNLDIKNCRNIRSIDIDFAPNLECFKYHGKFKDMRFKDVPKLSHVSLAAGRFGGDYCQKSLLELEKVGTLEKLELDLNPRFVEKEHAECTRNAPPRFPLLGNLKDLECRFLATEESCTPMILTVILAACPKLHKLTLNYTTDASKMGVNWLDLKKNDRWFGLTKDHLRDTNYGFHRCLKEVKFIGGCKKEDKAEAISYLKNIAPNLDA